ncbi:hypothetical protein WN48_07546 [Eufriesea mexicana]|uniref:Uncharacterized protein n=1 Tax=Eufriesea mexicana TaxID=516756 RepID=A0A310SSX6_9HYME|nr:hypothetical protein WN48_07546 [Eufriesea mexicana]
MNYSSDPGLSYRRSPKSRIEKTEKILRERKKVVKGFQGSSRESVGHSGVVDGVRGSRERGAILEERCSEHVLVPTQSHRRRRRFPTASSAGSLRYVQSIQTRSRDEDGGSEETGNVEKDELTTVSLTVLKLRIARRVSVILITALEMEVWPIFADARSLCARNKDSGCGNGGRGQRRTVLRKKATLRCARRNEDGTGGGGGGRKRERKPALRALLGISQVAESPTASTGFDSRQRGCAVVRHGEPAVACVSAETREQVGGTEERDEESKRWREGVVDGVGGGVAGMAEGVPPSSLTRWNTGGPAVIWSTHGSLNKVSPRPKFYEVSPTPGVGVNGVRGKSGNGDGLCESICYAALNNLRAGRVDIGTCGRPS